MYGFASVGPLFDLVAPTVEERPEVISTRIAAEVFGVRSRSSIWRDCKFLQIATADSCGYSAINRKGAYRLYAYMCWRKNWPGYPSKQYWRDVASNEALDSGYKLGPSTATTENKIRVIEAAGGSLADFNDRWERAIAKKERQTSWKASPSSLKVIN